MCVYRYGEISHSTAVLERQSCYNQMMKSLFKRLNRRSQKKSYNWDGFNDMLKEYPLVTPGIYVSVYAE